MGTVPDIESPTEGPLSHLRVVDLTTARTNQIQSFYSYNVAVAKVRKAVGLPDALMSN